MFLFKVPKRRPRGLHRRRRLHFWHHSREWFWPSMGLKPLLRWMELKIKRSRGTAYKAAMGAAIGVGVCFTPFLGFHFLMIFVLCRLLRSSFIVGAIFSFLGNPWTFPLIFLWTYEFGHWLLGTDLAQPALQKMPEMNDVFANFGFFFEHYIWPMSVGGVPSGIVVGAVVFFVLRGNIRRYQKYRIQRIRAARQRNKLQTEAGAEGRVAAITEKIKETGHAATDKVKTILHIDEE